MKVVSGFAVNNVRRREELIYNRCQPFVRAGHSYVNCVVNVSLKSFAVFFVMQLIVLFDFSCLLDFV